MSHKIQSNIWSVLEKNCDRNWLWDYSNQDNFIVDRNQKSSLKLKQLTELKQQEILSEVKNNPTSKLNIIIAESEPIQLLATFLGGIINEVNIFLCDPNWQRQEWQQVLNIIKPDMIFAESKIRNLISEINLNNTSKIKSIDNSYSKSLIMIPTGGSSGKIKFTMHNWSTLSTSVTGFQKYFECQKINSTCTLPLYHVSGLMQFMRSFMTQGNLVICSYKTIEKLEINTAEYFISLVPTQLKLLIESIPLKLKEFKTVLVGGASTSRSLLKEARKYAIPLAPTYGMTETASQIVTLKPQYFLAGNNSSGQVLPHAKVIIKSANNNPGLINIKCDSLCLGYYPQVFKSNLFTTDDLGYFDNQGYLYLIGRNSQKIISGGKNIFPAEIEATILATKFVKDICIIGVRDSKWGEAVTAIYVPKNSKEDLDIIKQNISLQLAKYKQPKNWIKVNSLPRNNRGKINYQKVKAIAEQIISNK